MECKHKPPSCQFYAMTIELYVGTGNEGTKDPVAECYANNS